MERLAFVELEYCARFWKPSFAPLIAPRITKLANMNFAVIPIVFSIPTRPFPDVPRPLNEAQLAAGIKVHTKEYEQNEKDIERVIQALERLEQKKRDLTNSRSGNEAERAKRSEAIANVKGQIKATEKQLESYQAYRQSMQFRNTDTERPYTGKLSDGNSFETAGAVMRQTAERIREVKEAATEAIKQVPVLGKVLSNVAYVGSKGWGGLKKLISGVASGIKTLASGAIQKSSGAFGALIQKFATGIPILKRTRSSLFFILKAIQESPSLSF